VAEMMVVNVSVSYEPFLRYGDEQKAHTYAMRI
jgi:hypothetical protein